MTHRLKIIAIGAFMVIVSPLYLLALVLGAVAQAIIAGYEDACAYARDLRRAW